jgi:hypothetical protein
MTKIKTEEKDEVQRIFNAIGIEKSPTDFTPSVMERISKEQPVLLVKQTSYYYRIIYFLSIIPAIAIIWFSPSLEEWVLKTYIYITKIDYTFINHWFSVFSKNMHSIISPTVLSIFAASTFLIGFYAIINSDAAINE